MKRIKKSFRHAFDGFLHGVGTQPNIRLFLWGYGFVLLLGALIGLLTWEWLALIIAGGMFLGVELLNSALEEMADVLDDQRKSTSNRSYHDGIKRAKDVAAGASLTVFTGVVVIILIVFAPYVGMFL
jgi:diacylglycerol kinase